MKMMGKISSLKLPERGGGASSSTDTFTLSQQPQSGDVTPPHEDDLGIAPQEEEHSSKENKHNFFYDEHHYQEEVEDHDVDEDLDESSLLGSATPAERAPGVVEMHAVEDFLVEDELDHSTSTPCAGATMNYPSSRAPSRQTEDHDQQTQDKLATKVVEEEKTTAAVVPRLAGWGSSSSSSSSVAGAEQADNVVKNKPDRAPSLRSKMAAAKRPMAYLQKLMTQMKSSSSASSKTSTNSLTASAASVGRTQDIEVLDVGTPRTEPAPPQVAAESATPPQGGSRTPSAGSGTPIKSGNTPPPPGAKTSSHTSSGAFGVYLVEGAASKVSSAAVSRTPSEKSGGLFDGPHGGGTPRVDIRNDEQDVTPEDDLQPDHVHEDSSSSRKKPSPARQLPSVLVKTGGSTSSSSTTPMLISSRSSSMAKAQAQQRGGGGGGLQLQEQDESRHVVPMISSSSISGSGSGYNDDPASCGDKNVASLKAEIAALRENQQQLKRQLSQIFRRDELLDGEFATVDDECVHKAHKIDTWLQEHCGVADATFPPNIEEIARERRERVFETRRHQPYAPSPIESMSDPMCQQFGLGGASVSSNSKMSPTASAGGGLLATFDAIKHLASFGGGEQGCTPTSGMHKQQFLDKGHMPTWETTPPAVGIPRLCKANFRPTGVQLALSGAAVNYNYRAAVDPHTRPRDTRTPTGGGPFCKGFYAPHRSTKSKAGGSGTGGAFSVNSSKESGISAKSACEDGFVPRKSSGFQQVELQQGTRVTTSVVVPPYSSISIASRSIAAASTAAPVLSGGHDQTAASTTAVVSVNHSQPQTRTTTTSTTTTRSTLAAIPPRPQANLQPQPAPQQAHPAPQVQNPLPLPPRPPRLSLPSKISAHQPAQVQQVVASNIQPASKRGWEQTPSPFAFHGMSPIGNMQSGFLERSGVRKASPSPMPSPSLRTTSGLQSPSGLAFPTITPPVLPAPKEGQALFTPSRDNNRQSATGVSSSAAASKSSTTSSAAAEVVTFSSSAMNPNLPSSNVVGASSSSSIQRSNSQSRFEPPQDAGGTTEQHQNNAASAESLKRLEMDLRASAISAKELGTTRPQHMISTPGRAQLGSSLITSARQSPTLASRTASPVPSKVNVSDYIYRTSPGAALASRGGGTSSITAAPPRPTSSSSTAGPTRGAPLPAGSSKLSTSHISNDPMGAHQAQDTSVRGGATVMDDLDALIQRTRAKLGTSKSSTSSSEKPRVVPTFLNKMDTSSTIKAPPSTTVRGGLVVGGGEHQDELVLQEDGFGSTGSGGGGGLEVLAAALEAHYGGTVEN
ncbi:unnamed protein product [Amoebophrya sp. A25]|nr:unnamed protein product [Amoebophrya sp. A25]|eukprot:GSA25T00012440001.1